MTMALLVSIHPALILLAVFAIPTVATSTWRPAVERAAQERGAQSHRTARHLSTSPLRRLLGKKSASPESESTLVKSAAARGRRWYGAVSKARWGSAWWHALAWAIFGLAYVGAVVFVSSKVLRAPAGEVLLVLAAGARLSAYIGATVGELDSCADSGRMGQGGSRGSKIMLLPCSLCGSGSSRGLGSRHPSRSRVLRLPGHVSHCAGRYFVDTPGWRCHCDRR